MQIQIAIGVIVYEIELPCCADKTDALLHTNINERFLAWLGVIANLILHKHVRIHAIGIGDVHIKVTIAVVVAPSNCPSVTGIGNEVYLPANIDKAIGSSVFIES